MDMTAIVVAVIVAVPTVLATTLVPLLTKRSERQERREVAARAAEAAELLAVNTKQAAEATQTLTDKVDVVHTLVNSNLTIATQKLREKTQRALNLLLEFEPSNSVEINVLKAELAELDAVLLDRLKQAKAVEAQQVRQSAT
jgi:hypothetical protein